jgi:hypothetical protein
MDIRPVKQKQGPYEPLKRQGPYERAVRVHRKAGPGERRQQSPLVDPLNRVFSARQL